MNRAIVVVYLAVAMAAISPSRMSGQAPSPFHPKTDCGQSFEQYRAAYQNATADYQNAEADFQKATDDVARQNAAKAQQDANTKQQSARIGLARLFNLREQPGCVAYLILAAYPNQTRAGLFLGFVTAAEKQVGSTSSTSGSTSLVSKNFTSRLLSVADEYGALTSSTSGQTTTVSGSLDQLFTAIEHVSSGAFVECAVKTIPGVWCVRSGLMNFLGRLSYSTSLDLNQPSTITGTATGTVQGTAQQVTGTQGGNSFALSQFTAKGFIWAAKPKKEDLLKAWTDSADTPAATARQKLIDIQKAAGDDPGGAWQKWLANALPVLLSSSKETDIYAQTQELMSTFVAGGTSAQDLVRAALDYSASLASTAAAERTAFDKAAWSKPILTFEYDYNTPSNQPTNSTFRLIWGQSLKNWKMTGNAAGSIYNSTPSSSIPGSGRLRDIQLGIEADRNPYQLGNSLTATFGAAYYFQNQTSPAILNVSPSSPISGVSFTGLSSTATQVFTQKGKIHVGQLKITLAGGSGSGWKFPIAITGSNRTELITKSTIGAQVGVSYDFDSLFAK
jgi:hypothetical protein